MYTGCPKLPERHIFLRNKNLILKYHVNYFEGHGQVQVTAKFQFDMMKKSNF